MAEYIEREAVYAEACRGCIRHGENIGECYSEEPCQKLIEAFAIAPAADVAPVVHGEWRRSEDGEFVCVNCKQVKVSHDMLSFFLSTERWNYCPNCGAKMDGVTSHQNRLLQPTGMTVAKIGGAE